MTARIGLATWTAIWLAAWSAWAQPAILQEIENSFIALHDRIGPCVVNIERQGSEEEAQEQLEELYRLFGQPVPEGQRPPLPPGPHALGTGSGFIYDSKGHIVTNNHVVEGAENISVRLYNGQEYEAALVGSDPETDLAVIKINAGEELAVAPLGDSDALKVGQFAVAIGSARGLEGSVSFGHISALGRENLSDLRLQGLTFQNLIQTDAAINLGNSGGPLCNIQGQVIGINVALVMGANRIGFSIPINTAKRTIPDLISQGKVSRGYLGVAIDDAKEFAQSVGLPDEYGAFVKRVQDNTPAERAGLQDYDVIRKVGDTPTRSAQELVNTISAFAPGAEVQLEIWRDQTAITIPVTLETRNLALAQRDTRREVLGMQLEELTPELAQRIGLGPDINGVVIVDVKVGSPAQEARLAMGDVILEFDRTPVGNLNNLMALVEKAAVPGKHLLVKYLRGADDPDITVIRVPAI